MRCRLEKKIILEVNNLNFSYVKHSVFKDANLKIAKSRITAIYGVSGSGKSTLLNIFSLLFRELDDYSISGEVIYNSENILALTQLEKKEEI